MFTFLQNCSLKPANEVWGKVIFSEAMICYSVHGRGGPTSGGGGWDLPTGGICIGGGFLPPRGYGQTPRTLQWEGGGWPDPSGSRKAGSTHPTGMVSSFFNATVFTRLQSYTYFSR